MIDDFDTQITVEEFYEKNGNQNPTRGDYSIDLRETTKEIYGDEHAMDLEIWLGTPGFIPTTKENFGRRCWNAITWLPKLIWFMIRLPDMDRYNEHNKH